jgi:hypothetical protein
MLMDRPNQERDHYECVEPELGAVLWQLESPLIKPALKQRLESHLTICDACRLERAVERAIGTGLQSGRLHLPDPVEREGPSSDHIRQADRQRPAWPLATVWGGLGLAVTSLVLIFVLAPTPLFPDLVTRAQDSRPRFLRPLESEVIRSLTPAISWTPIEDATRYRLTLEDIRGSYLWMTVTDQSQAAPPTEHALPPDSQIRATLETIPVDLLALGEVTVSFRTGSWHEYVGYRLKAAPSGLQITTLIGLAISLLAGLWIRLVRR